MEIRSWKVLFYLCLITAVLVSGCTGFKTPSVSRAAPPAIFVDYQRSGGFAGVSDRVVIFDNGVMLLSDGRSNTESSLNQTQLERIGAVFTTAKFAELEGNYTSGRGGADLFQYSISYHGKTIRTEDTAIPPPLQPVIDEMDSILAAGMAGSRPAGNALPRIGS